MRQLSSLRWLDCLRDVFSTTVIVLTFGLVLALCAGAQGVVA